MRCSNCGAEIVPGAAFCQKCGTPRREDVFFGTELDWFAVDRDGHIGHFATAGYGPIPQWALSGVDVQEQLEAYFLKQVATTEVVLVVPAKGVLDDWLKMAGQGIFSYDWKHWDGPYILIARPVDPIHLPELPRELQPLAACVVFDTICFAEEANLEPTKFTEC